MMNADVINPIPLEIAIQLCEEIRGEIDHIWYPTPARWCLHCQEQTSAGLLKRGFLRAAGNRGCLLVNARYAEMMYRKSAL